ncbi:ornithine racemase Orr [Wansuia hejianensis]|uniref:Alanine/ornithine racemase family PLP-dependent enzyme n=1 Tax=Wansuia hejianensis TaxID=2763667 RepID=A0A926F2A2_9FIRM|nr:ornithine racemase Orr [Wansuia hejianensis]MBC8590692.1 alanine/ornithine racemase family PLP-dependent enzyme [Wansuia hejianensis]
MNYPKLIIKPNIIEENVKSIVSLCSKNNIKVAGVTKGVCANKEIVKAYISGGVEYLADSRIENLINLKEYDIPKMMLRLPMISEVDLIVQYANISLNSELDTVKALSKAALNKNIAHKIILMLDLGDLREGIFDKKDIYKFIEEVLELPCIELIGIGTNLTCFGGLIPDTKILDQLGVISTSIENKYNLNIDIISGGNSSTIYLLSNGNHLQINNLRLGESLLLGKETSYGTQIKGTRDDGFLLQTEIIEIKKKPTVPIGNIGVDAFGKKPCFEDKGIRKKILCAIGKQDVKIDSLTPIDSDLNILGGSSDHLIIDGDDSTKDYKVGDILEFKLGYGGVLSAMTSNYVKKLIIE